ncbi:hypothetical protein ONS95_002657 [Cadophora gregata]|uniref:uncharacterized protein n=1 Tax=Cadophora gregata TaxID=51156 RepID=UPI0026DCF087|nr:uncharacterized protein ONS95_002657 [Cadophora gregata]KAK0109993.1 hypothetical protein ONS95_002657 [Cadophora gregata]KAK0110383.1 hypothetical protein ONS96_001998 [Cadophora gregata f. sp. sojae]
MPRLIWAKKLGCSQCNKPTFPYKLFETCRYCQHVPCGDCKVTEVPLNTVEVVEKIERKQNRDDEDPDEEHHLTWMTNLQRLHGSQESLVLKKQKKTFQW